MDNQESLHHDTVDPQSDRHPLDGVANSNEHYETSKTNHETTLFIRNSPSSPGHPDSPSEGSRPSSPVPADAAAAAPAPLWRWWYLDFLAIATALASLAAIIGVLVAFDGRFQDDWPSDVLTINGLVAILATVCRGALMASVGSVLSQEKWNRFSGYSGGATDAIAEEPRYRKLEDFTLFDKASRGPSGSLMLLWKFKAA